MIRFWGTTIYATALCGLLAACGGNERPLNATTSLPASHTSAADTLAPRLEQHSDIPMRPTVRVPLGKPVRAKDRRIVRSTIAEPLHVGSQEPLPLPGHPRITRASSRLQCVPYARQRSGIQIRGDAWTWWGSARGRYRRGAMPAVGAVLVLRRKGRSRGHLAYVTHVINDREIVVDHANWLNRGRIHRNTPVRDISAGNDWSKVQLWHIPTRQYGISPRRAYGFVYPVDVRSTTSQLIRPNGSG